MKKSQLKEIIREMIEQELSELDIDTKRNYFKKRAATAGDEDRRAYRNPTPANRARSQRILKGMNRAALDIDSHNVKKQNQRLGFKELYAPRNDEPNKFKEDSTPDSKVIHPKAKTVSEIRKKMAHDLKNESLRNKLYDPEFRKKYIDNMNKQYGIKPKSAPAGDGNKSTPPKDKEKTKN